MHCNNLSFWDGTCVFNITKLKIVNPLDGFIIVGAGIYDRDQYASKNTIGMQKIL